MSIINSKAYKNCEEYNNNKIKNIFRSIDQKITLYDILTNNNNFSYEVKNEANLLISELKNSSNVFDKNITMDKIDNFFDKIK